MMHSETIRETMARALDVARKAGVRAAVVPLALAAAAAPSDANAQIRQSRVDASVSAIGGGEFQYDFTLNNTSTGYNGDVLVDWELPFFAMTDIVAGSITTPSGWEAEIVTTTSVTTYFNNPAGPYGDYGWDYDPADDPTAGNYPTAPFLAPPFILHFYTVLASEGDTTFPARGLFEGQSLDGFSFRSAYGSAPAPYLGSWFRQPPRPGDPPIPDNGGMVTNLGIGSPEYYQAVPEPASFVAFAAGAALLLRRRKR